MKKIHLKSPYNHDEGHAYLYVLGEEVGRGDCSDFPKASYAYLLENGKRMGPAHALHYVIRNCGKGAFSHWEEGLVFSSSDNTDPNSNGRLYELCVPSHEGIKEQRQALIDSAGMDSEFYYEVIRSAVNTNGSAFSAYLAGFQNYQYLMSLCDIDFKGKTILEIGSGPNPGTALAFLLQGAGKFYANDRGKIQSEFSSSYAETVEFLNRLVNRRGALNLEQFLSASQSSKNQSFFRKDFYESFPETPAENIDLPDNSLDLIVSVSVLEHVTNPNAVLSNIHRMLKPGGICLHSIDLRDHSNFKQPLSFLNLSKEEYASRATENRWRASDFIEEFQKTGFRLLVHLMCDRLFPLGADGNMDMMNYFMSAEPWVDSYKKDFDQVVSWVTPVMRRGFHADYQSKSLEDLSVIGLIIVAKKE